MRLDDYISTVRIVKRRTMAKLMIEGGKVKINGKSVKPAHPVRIGDIIRVTSGENKIDIEVIDIPMRSVRKDECEKFYKRLI
ncbi:MAG: RNA-binding S4 domain-containing protein [candidate division Zixibacteria bacterium]|nr:RNA-binding S4 domain-containing protein [candidate division Zixibacteria bacterium]MBU1470940.1 RNA-binding S4 domain-containing protein [candidate division Zixibacteria bacterium]MBU2625455.1 RNA-binding S4 domain-containing protein [candidate division Zixibacteria bacterium]